MWNYRVQAAAEYGPSVLNLDGLEHKMIAKYALERKFWQQQAHSMVFVSATFLVNTILHKYTHDES